MSLPRLPVRRRGGLACWSMRRTTLIDPRGVAWSIDVPETWRERIRGLRRIADIAPYHGMLFQRCRSVHTFGMRFEIEVAFLDAEDRVIVVRRGPPGRLLVDLRARRVLECAPWSGLRPGDVLRPAPASGEGRAMG